MFQYFFQELKERLGTGEAKLIRRFPESGVQGSRRRGMRTRKRGISGNGSESEHPGIKRGRSRDHRLGKSLWRGAQLPVLRIDVAVAAAISLTHGRQQSTFHCDRRTPDTKRAVA